MMKLPDDRRLRSAITSAKCPSCGRTGANLSKSDNEPTLWCTWCNHRWPLVLQD